MKEITVSQLRHDPTTPLAEVETSETYVVTRHRRAVARLVPIEVKPVVVISAKDSGGSRLVDRPRDGMRTYVETEALLREMASAW